MTDIFDCVCPEGAIDNIVSDACKTHRLPKIGRLWFQKVQTANNFIAVTNPINEAASFTGLTSAGDDTQLSVTPLLVDVSFGEGDIIDASENLDGATTKSGVGTNTVIATVEDPTAEQVEAIQGLFCKDSGSLGVFFVFANDTVMSKKIGTGAVTDGAIPISTETFIAPDPQREGGNGSRFIFKFQFDLAPGWYKNSRITKAEDGLSYITGVKGV
jgi:hypothetical protein